MKKNNLQKNINSEQNGFSLIETIIAIFILVIAITGPLAAASNSLKASFYARDQVVAFYLAQDVIEAIKNYRDNSYMDRFNGGTLDWREEVCFKNSIDCAVDTSGLKTGQTIDFKNSSPDYNIYLNQDSDLYTHSPSGSNTIQTRYSRKVKFEQYPNPGSNSYELKIIVTVEWSPRFSLSDKKKIVVQENIYNWLEFN